MFRSLLKRTTPSVRHYSAEASTFSVDIDALLARVKNASAQKSANKNNTANKILNKKKRVVHHNSAKRENSTSDASFSATSEKPSSFEQTRPQQQNKSRNFTKPDKKKTSGFGATSGNNSNNRGPRNINTQNKPKPRPSQALVSNNLRKSSSKGPRPARSNTGRSSSSSSSSSTSSRTKIVNTNYSKIQTAYTPEIPTVETLLSQTQLTSQTPASRLFKAYQALQINPEANVSGILTGKSTPITDAVVAQMKTGELKLNAHSVVNSLNKNPSLNADIRAKLVGPLVGLQPVNALSAQTN